MNNRANIRLREVNSEVRVSRSLVRVINASEALDLAGTGSLVDAATVRLLGVLERSSNMDEEEGARLFDKLASLLAGFLKGGNGGGNDGSTGLGQLRGDKGNARDVEVAVGLAEAELRRQLRAHRLTEEHGDGTATTLVEGRLQRSGDLVLAAVLEAGHEDGEALFAGQRVLLAQDLDDLGIGEPSRDLLAGLQTVAQLGAGNVHGAGALGNLVGGHVLVAVGDVNHFLELNHLDAELFLVLLDELLGVIRAVVVLAILVLARASVVTANNEVGRAVVLADDGVPEGLAGTTHAHGQRQQGESGHAVGVSRQQGLVDSDTGEVVNVAGFGQADNRVDEDVGPLRAGSADRQLAVSAVHGVASLEGNDLFPAQFVEVRAQLGGGDWEEGVRVVRLLGEE